MYILWEKDIANHLTYRGQYCCDYDINRAIREGLRKSKRLQFNPVVGYEVRTPMGERLWFYYMEGGYLKREKM